jgi:hypothetical protein
MGNVANKCSCLTGKEQNLTLEKFDESPQKSQISYQTNKLKGKKIEEEFMKSRNTLHSNHQLNDLFMKTSSSGIVSESNLSRIKKSKQEKNSQKSYSQDELIIRFLTSLQSLVLGYLYRKKYPKIKQRLLENLQKILEKYETQFRTVILYKAEKLRLDAYEKNGWLKYYDLSSNHLFKYENGIKLKTKFLLYNENSYYIGEVNINNQRNGIGVMVDFEGLKYQGNWVNNKFTGWGRHIDKEGNFYEGTINHNYYRSVHK